MITVPGTRNRLTAPSIEAEMGNTVHQQAHCGEINSLQTLLGSIDRETAPALARDLAFLRARALGNVSKRKAHISFILGRQEMALAIDAIQEIGHHAVVTPLPNLPRWIRGIIQIRGEILSVVDFVTLFGLQNDRLMGVRQTYILFRKGDLKFCLPVSRITGVLNIDEQRDTVKPYPSERPDIPRPMVQILKGVFTVDNREVFILDAEKLGVSPLIRKWQES